MGLKTPESESKTNSDKGCIVITNKDNAAKELRKFEQVLGILKEIENGKQSCKVILHFDKGRLADKMFKVEAIRFV